MPDLEKVALYERRAWKTLALNALVMLLAAAAFVQLPEYREKFVPLVIAVVAFLALLTLVYAFAASANDFAEEPEDRPFFDRF